MLMDVHKITYAYKKIIFCVQKKKTHFRKNNCCNAEANGDPHKLNLTFQDFRGFV